MKLTFCGGADEVGASCTLVELAGKRLLVDCGIRHQPKRRGSLPTFKKVMTYGGIEAIIVTHSHIDHIGALPYFFKMHQPVPIYLSQPSAELMSILLEDSFQIASESPLLKHCGAQFSYARKELAAVYSMLHLLPMNQPQQICGGRISATLIPSGHILGAASVFLESDKESALFTGDISLSDQLTVTGSRLPDIRPDVIVTESTYGATVRDSREQQEEKLLEQVKQVIDDNGSILFPVFAIGRAQEITLLLTSAMEKRLIERVPIIVDGMARTVCGTYCRHPDYVSPWFKGRIVMGSPYPNVRRVRTPADRELALKSQSAIFISSSGMLTGGPSVYYAKALADSPKNMIAFTGYQDEESPGWIVQRIQSGRRVKFGDERVIFNCKVGTYSLSAHADKTELVTILSQLNPHYTSDIILVHGEETARTSLSEELQAVGHRCTLPHLNGVFKNAKHSFVRFNLEGKSQNEPDAKRQALLPRQQPDRKKKSDRPHLVKESEAETRLSSQQEFLQFIERYFQGPTKPAKVRFDKGLGEVTLVFGLIGLTASDFNSISQIEQASGWKITISNERSTKGMTQTILNLLPQKWQRTAFSNYHSGRERYEVTVDAKLYDRQTAQTITEQFRKLAGVDLVIGVFKSDFRLTYPTGAGEQAVQEKAKSIIRKAFEGTAAQLLKIGFCNTKPGAKKANYIKLTASNKEAISKNRLQTLADVICWPIELTGK